MPLYLRTARGQVPSSAASQLAAPSNQAYVITKFLVHNPSGSAVTDLKIYVNDSGDAATAHQIYEQASVADAETVIIPINGLNLYNGEFIAMSAGTNNALEWQISYSQVTGNP
jgi:hypothetical protein